MGSWWRHQSVPSAWPIFASVELVTRLKLTGVGALAKHSQRKKKKQQLPFTVCRSHRTMVGKTLSDPFFCSRFPMTSMPGFIVGKRSHQTPCFRTTRCSALGSWVTSYTKILGFMVTQHVCIYSIYVCTHIHAACISSTTIGNTMLYNVLICPRLEV